VLDDASSAHLTVVPLCDCSPYLLTGEQLVLLCYAPACVLALCLFALYVCVCVKAAIAALPPLSLTDCSVPAAVVCVLC
jgi:hypothetical protein